MPRLLRQPFPSLPLLFALLILSGCLGQPRLEEVDTVRLCAGGDCVQAGRTYRAENLLGAVEQLLLHNRDAVFKICEADEDSRVCTREAIRIFVMGGPIPGAGSTNRGELFDTKVDRKKGTLTSRVQSHLGFIGTPLVCKETEMTIRVLSADKIVLSLADYYCNWMAVGNLLASFNMAIDYVDLDKGRLGGYYRLSTTGIGAGKGSGYAVLRFPIQMAKEENWLQSVAGALAVLPPAAPAETAFGRYHALIIGNDAYAHLPPLQTARNDARALASLLAEEYGFSVRTVIDATRADILREIAAFRNSLTENDNLLIYYAGHGWLDEAGDEGYWLPVDATSDDKVNWVSNSSITTDLRAIRARHVMVVADSCYSGKLVRGIDLVEKKPGQEGELARKKSRVVLSSGGLEPVADGEAGGRHSVFAAALLHALQENSGVLHGAGLYQRIHRPVLVNADQTPQYGDIRKAGHDGGDFLFVRPAGKK